MVFFEKGDILMNRDRDICREEMEGSDELKKEDEQCVNLVMDGKVDLVMRNEYLNSNFIFGS
jgi:hypothetical protein